jgi:hypothetical protein
MWADLGFVGPLRAEHEAWADRTLAADSAAALFEPVHVVIRRREDQIAHGSSAAVTCLLCADEGNAQMIGFKAIAETRALARFMASSPECCLDCLVLGHCDEHRRTGTGAEGDSDSQPEWRRFGADGSTSATG